MDSQITLNQQETAVFELIERGVPANALELRALGRDALVELVRDGNKAWIEALDCGDEAATDRYDEDVERYLDELSNRQ